MRLIPIRADRKLGDCRQKRAAGDNDVFQTPLLLFQIVLNVRVKTITVGRHNNEVNVIRTPSPALHLRYDQKSEKIE